MLSADIRIFYSSLIRAAAAREYSISKSTDFLADRAVLCPPVCFCLWRMHCGYKRCELEQKLIDSLYRKSYRRNRLVPKWMTLTYQDLPGAAAPVPEDPQNMWGHRARRTNQSIKKPIESLLIILRPFLNALMLAESITGCGKLFHRSMTRSEKKKRLKSNEQCMIL